MRTSYEKLSFITLRVDKTQFLIHILIAIREPSRPLFPHRADHVVNFNAEALTLAPPFIIDRVEQIRAVDRFAAEKGVRRNH